MTDDDPWTGFTVEAEPTRDPLVSALVHRVAEANNRADALQARLAEVRALVATLWYVVPVQKQLLELIDGELT